MALEFGDPTCGFRHTEVMRFINNEILMNGGGHDFYLIFRSRAWTEVEDALYGILGDPQIPRSHKRACAWSALALAVRGAAEPGEQHVRRVRRLKEQLGARESLSWDLEAEMRQLRQRRDEEASQLSLTRSALRRVRSECDALRGRLLQFERCAQAAPLTQAIAPAPQAGQLRATARPLNSEQQGNARAMGQHGRLFSKTAVAAPPGAVYMPRPPSSWPPSGWAPSMRPPLTVVVPSSFPFGVPFPMGLPPWQPLTPIVVTQPRATVPFQVPPVGIYPPGPLALRNLQNEMAPLWDHSRYDQVEGPEMLPGSVPGDNRSLRQKDLQRPQGMPVLGETGYHRHEGDPERSLEMTPPRERGNHNQEEGPLWLHGLPFRGENWQYSQEGQGRPPWMDLLGDSRRHSQEDNQEGAQRRVPPGCSDTQSQADVTEKAQDVTHAVIDGNHSKEEGTEYIQAMPAPGTIGGGEKGQGVIPTQLSRMQEDEERAQGMIPPGLKSHKLEECSERAQDATVWKSPSQALRESPKKRQPQQQKTNQKQEKETLESQQQKSASCHSPVNWVCPCCKAMNFSWHTTCSKCKICTPVESGDVDPEQTH